MRIAVILAVLVLSGCASTTAIVENVPDAVGTHAAAKVFGGEVGYSHAPKELMQEEVNKTSRRVYSDAQHGTKDAISNAIMRLFGVNK